MNLRTSERFTTRDAVEIYGIDQWGGGYFDIDRKGRLRVLPDRDPARAIELLEVLRRLGRRGVGTPVLLRFPQLLEAQVRTLIGAFRQSIAEFGYGGAYRPVFPIKVNHHRGVVESLLSAGWRDGLGIEVGSRPELLGAMAIPAAPDSLLICNGYKDRAYVEAASMATRLGRNVVAVLEKPFELDPILELARGGDAVPDVGVRVKLHARGSGMWEKSGGFASKFGLSTRQLLVVVERLREAGLLDRFVLLHFHIGSQITEIRKVKNAVREAARVYAKLRKLGADVRYLDVGGGLGVDYDGSKTSSDASVNYAVQEYANDVVFGIHEVCDQEHVPPPTIVSESGRMLSAYHSVLISDVRGAISGNDGPPSAYEGERPQVVEDLEEVCRTISVKNYREFFHDAQEYRDQLDSMFRLGLLELEDRAIGETLFREIAEKTVRFSKTAKFQAEEFQELENRLLDKYICNFSVFQSLPDQWALDQLFPVTPIHRLDERPSVRATLVDITCDSDGEIDKFVDLKDIKEALELHPLEDGAPYYVAVLLIGAYQDTMGDVHNLFGRVHEAQVLLDPDGETVVRDVRRGDRSRDTLAHFGYRRDRLVEAVEARALELVRAGDMPDREASRLVEAYAEGIERYTYLD